MFRNTLAALIPCAVLSTAPATAAVVAYTDFDSWQAAVGAIAVTENFNGNFQSVQGNTTGNAIGSQLTFDLIGGVSDPGPSGITGSGFFQSEVDSSLSNGLKAEFHFGGSYTAFAIDGLQDDSTTPGTLTVSEISMIVGGEAFVVSDVLGLTDSSSGSLDRFNVTGGGTFVGFVSSTAMTGFSIVHTDEATFYGASGSTEEYYIDQMHLAGAVVASVPISSVPVPAALPLLALGMGVFGVMGWRRRASE